MADDEFAATRIEPSSANVMSLYQVAPSPLFVRFVHVPSPDRSVLTTPRQAVAIKVVSAEIAVAKGDVPESGALTPPSAVQVTPVLDCAIP